MFQARGMRHAWFDLGTGERRPSSPPNESIPKPILIHRFSVSVVGPVHHPDSSYTSPGSSSLASRPPAQETGSDALCRGTPGIPPSAGRQRIWQLDVLYVSDVGNCSVERCAVSSRSSTCTPAGLAGVMPPSTSAEDNSKGRRHLHRI